MALDTVQFELPAEILDAAKMTPAELKIELAVSLYQRGRLAFSKAREVAGLTVWEFRQLLGSRRIPVQYDEDDLSDDLDTLRALL
jgi:predicted HTH domain antitoxin